MYGTLPKSTRSKTKYSKEEYATMMVEKIIKDKNQETISSLLSCCQLYTSPLLIIRELRSVFLASSPRFEKAKKAQIVQLNTSTVNYHTIRRPRKAPKPAAKNDELDQILSQIEELKLKLFDPAEEAYSRDSGIASSIVSDDEFENCTEDGHVTPLDLRSKIAEVVVAWIKKEPMVFVDDVVFHVMRKFLDEIAAAKILTQNTRALLDSSMKSNSRISTSFFCKITPLTNEPLSNLKNFDLQKTLGPLAAHINHLDAMFYKNLSRDDVISQLVQAGVRPRWNSYLNSMARLNSLVSIAILKSPSPAEAAKTIDMFVILACCCRRAKNYNATITIITALLSKPIQRLSKTWTKVKELQNLAMLKTLANPSNNFRSLRKELKSQKEVLAPYLTLVGKDVFWIAQGANESQNIHEVESRTKLLARSIPRPARRVPEPCENCRIGEKCKIMEALTTFSIMSDDALYHLSYKMESPTNSFEKEEFRSLKPKKKPVRSLRKLIQLLV